jgi:hypothetical protein
MIAINRVSAMGHHAGKMPSLEFLDYRKPFAINKYMVFIQTLTQIFEINVIYFFVLI